MENQKIEQIPPETEFEKLKKDLSELKDVLQKVDEKYKVVKSEYEKIKNLISTLPQIKKDYKEMLEKLSEEVHSSLLKTEDYKKHLSDLDKEVNEIISQSSQILAEFREEVIEQYDRILTEKQKLAEDVKFIENKVNEIFGKVEQSKKSLESGREPPQVIVDLLNKYAVRKSPQEEASMLVELMEEDPEVLKLAIEIGRQRGYTTRRLMPLIAAYALWNYSKGVKEEVAKALGVRKELIERYLVNVGSAADPETNAKIVGMMVR